MVTFKNLFKLALNQLGLGLNKKHLYLVLLIAFVCSYGYISFTVNYIKKSNPNNEKKSSQSLVANTMIYSPDDYWYVNQYKNWREGRGFTIDPAYKNLSVRRTPVYPIIYGFFTYEFGYETGIVLLRHFQVLLFCISSCLIYLIVAGLNQKPKVAFMAALIYAACPFLSSYLPFTITESITPFLVVFSVYCYMKAIKTKNSFIYFLTGIVSAICILNRPLCLVLATAMIVTELLFNYTNRKVFLFQAKRSILILIGAVIIFAPWVIRNFKVTNGEIIILEKLERKDIMDYGHSLIELRSMVSCFGNPADYSCELFVQRATDNIASNNADRNQVLLEDFVASFPDVAFRVWNRDTLKSAINEYLMCYESLYKRVGNIGKINVTGEEEFLKCNERLSMKYSQMTDEFKNRAFLNYYVLTPLGHLKDIIFQSNTANVAWLQPSEEGYSWSKKSVKAILYLANASFYILFFVGLFSRLLPQWYRILSGISFLTLFIILTFEYRYFETRYYLIVWPFIIINSTVLLSYLYETKLKSLLRRSKKTN